MDIRILRNFLESRGAQSSDSAVCNIARSTGTRVLASAMAVTGAELGELSAQEVAEGLLARPTVAGCDVDALEPLHSTHTRAT
jgi:hypothetical protein